REALVHQSAVSAPGHMAGGFQRALASDRASLHIVASGTCAGGVEPTVGRWLHAGAAAESRAHPLFLYDPSRGASWADRFDFDGNEQPDRDWPEHQLDCQDAGGAQRTLPQSFTFADYAILEPAYREHYRLIPEDCPTGDLATIAEYLADDRDADRRIPYVWVAGPDGAMRRAAIARRLTAACRDRLSCWRTLQQCAGIHDVYAERAVASERQRAAEDADARIAQLKAEHAAEIERIRLEEAGAALGKLAESILGVDLTNLTAAPARAAPKPSSAPQKAPEEAASSPEAAPAAEAEEEDLGFDEPYIDSPLCTTCNDCINLNPRLFKYNENKQAVIADPDAGSYAELVHAAEKCPARCIRPGKPRNPDEPGLDDLIKRAKPFNGGAHVHHTPGSSDHGRAGSVLRACPRRRAPGAPR
ncbi:MAG: ferredoxin, partial [Phycisphaerales bacterium JB039]